MTRDELRESLRGWAFDLAVAGVAGAFLGLLGPFGSYFSGPLWQRLAYWIGSVWLGTLVYGSAVRLVLPRAGPGPRGWLVLAAGVPVMAAPFALLISALARAVWPVLESLGPLDWYVQVLLISTPLVFAQALVVRVRRRRRLGREARAEPPSPQGLLGASPAEVLVLQMEDHYVRVHTRAGSRLVLATLGQAMAALKGAPGLQVHRSWWVAETAVAAAVPEGRNLRLRLVNGMTAPVARAAVAKVRAAGWISGPPA